MSCEKDRSSGAMEREALEGGVDEVVIRSAIGDPNVRTVIHG